MPKEFKFPDIGEGIEEGKIVKWLIKEGDKIEEHQVVGEVETDKAVAEIPSPYSGTVLKINFKEGETVKVGQVLFVVDDGSPESSKPQEKSGPKFNAAGAVGYLEEAPDEVETKPKNIPVGQASQGPSVFATPAVRNLSRQLGIDLTKIQGSGPGGRITEDDLKDSQTKSETPQEKRPEMKVVKKYDMWGYIDHIPLKGMRKAIAKHMVESVRNAPHVTTMDEVDVNDLVIVREREKVKAEQQGIKLTYLPFVMKAVLMAMKEFPLVNATVDEENEDIIVKKYYNFGFAVDVGEGLVVPVVKGVDQKNIFDIAKELKELSDKARDKKLDLMDMRGGTFSITNYGSIGGLFATPIINYPEVVIIGLGVIYEKPVVIDGKIGIRKVLPISLTFDHRIVDGAYATRFLISLMNNLRDPEKLLE